MRDIEKYTECYIEDDFGPTMVEIRRRMLLEQISVFSPKTILEIGCGMSPIFMHLPKSFEKMVIVEPSSTFFYNAKGLIERNNLHDRVTIEHGFLENLVDSLKNMKVQFDCIIVSSLLHEVESSCDMIKAVRSLCSKSTIVHINVPNAKSLHRLIALECGMIEDLHELSERSIQYQQHRTYDLDMLKKELTEFGFQIVSSGSYFIKPFTHAQMQKCLSGKIIDKKIINGLENISKYFPEYGAEIYVNARLT